MLQPDDIEQIRTEDGSTTLLHRKLNVTYKSLDGAISESEFVFLKSTKIDQRQSPWTVMELGFGGAVNFTVTAMTAIAAGKGLLYRAIDHQPIPPEYIIGESAPQRMARKALQYCRQKSKTAIVEENGIVLELHPVGWQDVALPQSNAHAIYHDPFSPVVNPDCWNQNCFRWEFAHLAEDGILATYGAAGKMRRAMAKVGFHVAIAEGFGRKRERTIAAKRGEYLDGHKIKYQPER